MRVGNYRTIRFGPAIHGITLSRTSRSAAAVLTAGIELRVCTMLTHESRGEDWVADTADERRAYVEAACQRCREAGLEIPPWSAQEGISEYFRDHAKFHHDVGDAFGEVSSAIARLGYYPRLNG